MKFTVSSKAGTVCGGVRSITISEGAGISVSGKAGTAKASSSVVE